MSSRYKSVEVNESISGTEKLITADIKALSYPI